MSLSGSLQIGRSALSASQLALQVVGNNLANAATPGYSRQVARLTADGGGVDASTGYSLGRGVKVTSVRRQIDTALETRLQDAISREQGAGVDQRVLSQVESIMNELSGTDLSTELGRFFDAFSELANNPTASEVRSIAIEQGASLASFVRALRNDLRTSRDQIDSQLASSTARANDILSEIAGLNVEIATSELGQGSANDLRDRRDRLVGELSELLDVSTIESPSGGIDVYVGSTPVILANVSRGLEYYEDPSTGDVTVQVRVTATQEPLSVTSGSIGALLVQRDGAVNRTIDDLDALAANLIFEVNRLHANGRPGTPLTDTRGDLPVLAADQTRAFNDPANTSFSSLIVGPSNGSFRVIITDPTGAKTTTSIDVDLDGVNALGAPGYGNDTTLTSLTAAINAVPNLNAQILPGGQLRVYTDAGYDVSFADDTSGILATLGINAYFIGHDAVSIDVREDLRGNPGLLVAGADPSTGRASNAVALGVSQLRREGLAGLDGSSLTDSWRNTVERVGSESASAQVRAQAASLVRENLDAQRAGISGVSVDEESINLITYQRQYQGAARFISVVDEMLQTLLNLV